MVPPVELRGSVTTPGRVPRRFSECRFGPPSRAGSGARTPPAARPGEDGDGNPSGSAMVPPLWRGHRWSLDRWPSGQDSGPGGPERAAPGRAHGGDGGSRPSRVGASVGTRCWCESVGSVPDSASPLGVSPGETDPRSPGPQRRTQVRRADSRSDLRIGPWAGEPRHSAASTFGSEWSRSGTVSERPHPSGWWWDAAAPAR